MITPRRVMRSAPRLAPAVAAAVLLQAVFASASTYVYHRWDPVVAVAGQTASHTLTAVIEGGPTLVQLVTPAGPILPLTRADGNTYQLTMSTAELLDGYVEGDAHNLIGHLQVYDGTTRTFSTSVFANVRDATMPAATVSAISEDAQASGFVVNLRRDALWLSGSAPQEVLQRFYELFPDDFDFIAVISQVRTPRNRSLQFVRNATTGTGRALFDNGAVYGSESRLLAIINYPIDSSFDLAGRNLSHEIGHQWMAFLSNAALKPGIAHWPISDLAYGVTGFSLPGGAGGEFPFRLVRRGNGDYRVRLTERPRAYNPLELYLMGLVPAAEVPDFFVFENQDQRDQLVDGGVLEGPVEVLSIDDVIAENGPREPGVGDAQTEFAMATIVLSAGRLLSVDEMTFFDSRASRGEATSELWYTEGFDSGYTKPFHLATGGLATLSTSIPVPEPSASVLIAVGAYVLGVLCGVRRRSRAAQHGRSAPGMGSLRGAAPEPGAASGLTASRKSS